MLEIKIPGYKTLRLQHLVLDYNGTLAFDGKLIPGVAERLHRLSGALEIHVLTADTFDSVEEELTGVNCVISILPGAHQDKAKLEYVSALGSESTVSVGNGRNDRMMLKAAVLGIVAVQGEGAAVETIQSADIAVNDILSAIDLLLNPLRLTATLRS